MRWSEFFDYEKLRQERGYVSMDVPPAKSIGEEVLVLLAWRPSVKDEPELKHDIGFFGKDRMWHINGYEGMNIVMIGWRFIDEEGIC